MDEPSYRSARLAQPKSIEELHWPAEELLEDRAGVGHFGLAREILAAAGGCERDLIPLNLFWYGLAHADWDLAEFCIDIGFDLNPKEDDGPIQDAFTYLPGRPDVIGWLLDHGADVERRGYDDSTPLIRAAHREGEAATLAVRLAHGADVEAGAVEDGDMTPLMVAAGRGNVAAVRLLLEHGADPNRTDNYTGKDAAEHARFCKQFEVAELIERHRTGPLQRNRRRVADQGGGRDRTDGSIRKHVRPLPDRDQRPGRDSTPVRRLQAPFRRRAL